jgi:hypothetical protein
MKWSSVVMLALLAISCATHEMGRYITPEDLAFIQKGKTTRAEVVQRLGKPMGEGPDPTLFQFKTTTTTTKSKTTVTPEGETQTEAVTTMQVEPIKKGTKAMYLHTSTEGGAFRGMKQRQERVWIMYDEAGIVQDYTFEVLK